MNEMYNMGIVTHYYGVLGVLGVVFVNLFILSFVENVYKYRRIMRIFTPIGSIMIGSVIFTGIVMMAAKHLEFDLNNIAMIIGALLFIVLEVKRVKSIKFVGSEEFELYERAAKKILYMELFIVAVLSVWMKYDLPLQ